MKPLDQYYASTHGFLRRHSKCIQCYTVFYAKKRHGNREYYRSLRRKYYWSDPLKFKDRRMKHRYGIGMADYDRMFTVQHGLCAICGETSEHPLALDHDHQGGTVRELLCLECNRGIGAFAESPLRMLRAARYVERHNAKREQVA